MKKRISLVICAILVMALAIVPMLALVASADDLSYTHSSSAQGYTNAQSLDGKELSKDAAISIVMSKNGGSTAPAYYTSGAALRLYTKNKITIKANDGYELVSVVFTATGDNSGLIASSNAVSDGATLTVTNSNKTGTVSCEGLTEFYLQRTGTKHTRITNIVVNYREVGGEVCAHANRESVLVPPTCNTAGYYEDRCADCGKDAKLVEGSEIPATGHSGCEEDWKCDVCGKIGANTTELTLAEATALAKAAGTAYTADMYTITGKITSIANTQYGNVYIKDAEGNTFYVYGIYSADGSVRYDKLDPKPAVNDTITVTGILGTYSGTAQMKNSWLLELTAGTTECEHVDADGDFICDNECGMAVEPEADQALTFAQANALAEALGGGYSTNKYYLTGIVTEIVKDDYGNLYIEDAEGNIFYIYGTYNFDGTVRYDALEYAPQVNDEITIWGVIGSYNGVPQMKSGWLDEVVMHEHDYNESLTKAPTCEDAGEKTFTCACGDSYTEPVNALGHSYDEGVETKAPTCTEDGENTFTCSKCGDSYTEAIKAHGHRYSSVKVTPATCTENGYITLGCGNCGGEWDSRYDDEAKQYLIDNPYFNLSAKGHKYEAVVTEPTCTADGYTTYTCACGHSYTEAGEAAKGHRYSKTQVVTFCEEEGYVLIECGDCGEQFDSRYDDEAKQYIIDLPFFNLAPKGHKYENGVCTNEGCDATIGRIDEAQVNLGADLGVKWYVVLPEGADVADYVFTVEFLGESFVLEAVEADGRYMYFFANIAPQNMGDAMKATLALGEDTVVLDNYSVKKNLLNIAAADATLETLVADLLNYGAAAQVYMEYNVDNLVNADVAFAGSADEIVNPGYTLEGNAKENSAYFKSANVLFASTNRVIVKVVVNTNATLVVGEKTYNLTAGEYEIYSADIAATDLFDNVTFTLTGEDGNVTTLNYSVAAYAAAKAGNESAMGKLATALYYYAASIQDLVD